QRHCAYHTERRKTKREKGMYPHLLIVAGLHVAVEAHGVLLLLLLLHRVLEENDLADFAGRLRHVGAGMAGRQPRHLVRLRTPPQYRVQ
ncbi:MAG: hypothetical protein ACK56I_03825, partial [bacterium]